MRLPVVPILLGAAALFILPKITAAATSRQTMIQTSQGLMLASDVGASEIAIALNLGGIKFRTPEQQFNRDVFVSQRALTREFGRAQLLELDRAIEIAVGAWNQTHSVQAGELLASLRAQKSALKRSF